MTDTSTGLDTNQEKTKIGTVLLEAGFFLNSSVSVLESKYPEVGIYLYIRILERLCAEGGRVSRVWIDHLLSKSSLGLESKTVFELLIDLGLVYLDGKLVGSKKVDQELLTVSDKRKRWRISTGKYRESLKPVIMTQNQNQNIEVEVENRNRKEVEVERETEPKQKESRAMALKTVGISKDPDTRKPRGKKQLIWLSDRELQELVNNYGEPITEQCLKKLSNWIERDPVEGKIRAGKDNAFKNLTSWVIESISGSNGKGHSPVMEEDDLF